MALIKCRECGREVSSKAKNCPSCGVNAPWRTKTHILFAWVSFSFLAVALLVIWLAGGEKKTDLASEAPIKDVVASEKPQPIPKDGAYSPQHKKVQDIFRSAKEPTAKDALWTDKNIFKVGVINDGSLRNGYAESVCQVLYDEGFSGKRVYVQIVDIVKLQSTGAWEKIGEAQCQ